MERKNFSDENWTKVTIKGVECLFNDLRIKRDSIPAGKFMYEVADADSDGVPCRMRQGILVNFFGTIVSDVPFTPDFEDDDTIYLNDDDFCFVE